MGESKFVMRSGRAMRGSKFKVENGTHCTKHVTYWFLLDTGGVPVHTHVPQMMEPRGLRTILQCLASGIVVYAAQAHGQALVTDDGFSFSPDPVNIIAGGTVDWEDDGSGPYVIISDTGAWTPFLTPG